VLILCVQGRHFFERFKHGCFVCSDIVVMLFTRFMLHFYFKFFFDSSFIFLFEYVENVIFNMAPFCCVFLVFFL